MINQVRKELQINNKKISFNKTKILKAGQENGRKTAWVIKEGAEIQAIIEQTEEMKYLGVEFGGKEMIERQKKVVMKKCKKLLGTLKWKTKEIEDKNWAVDEMWRQHTRSYKSQSTIWNGSNPNRRRLQ